MFHATLEDVQVRVIALRKRFGSSLFVSRRLWLNRCSTGIVPARFAPMVPILRCGLRATPESTLHSDIKLFKEHKVLALIPARANSKGLPGKNTKLLAGKPMIGWSIDAALGSAFIDRTVVTTDSVDTGRIALSLGADVPFIRPEALALDDTPGIEPVLHACRQLPGYDLIVVLQPTSPLRVSADIDAAIELLHRQDADFCISVTRPRHHPNWLYMEADDGFLQRYEKLEGCDHRQALKTLFAPNGAVYVGRTGPLLAQKSMSGPRTVAYEMNELNSWDIDTVFDFAVCELVLTGQNAVFCH